MPVTISGTTGLTTPGIAVDGVTAGVSGGFFSSTDNDGTRSSGTYTPVLTPSNWKYIVNGGAFTLAAPAGAGSGTAYTMIIYIENNASAGAITMSGFSKVTGDSFTTTNGHRFIVYITVYDVGPKIANVVAAQ